MRSQQKSIRALQRGNLSDLSKEFAAKIFRLFHQMERAVEVDKFLRGRLFSINFIVLHHRLGAQRFYPLLRHLFRLHMINLLGMTAVC